MTIGVDVRRTTVIGLAGSLVQLTFAAWLGGIAGGVDAFPNPPEPVPRGLALGLLYTLPALIGALGALRRRRSMLAAAAVLSCAGSILAFSGVTLVFLVPALVFATAAGVTSGVTPRARPSWRALVLLALSVAAVVVAVLRLGILVLPLLVLFVLALEVGRGLRAHAAGPGSQVAGSLLAVVVVCLGIGAGWALLSMTEMRCWEAYQTPDGIEYRTVPDPGTGSITLEPGGIGGGCDSGALTMRGAITASALGLTAVALAARLGRRHATERLAGARVTRGRERPRRRS